MQIRRTTGFFALSLMTMFFLYACGGGGDSGGGGAAIKTPVTTTLAALPITTDNATLNGAVNPNGDNTVAWFEWGTNSGLSPFTQTPNQTLGSGTVDIPLTFNLTSLTSGTTYYFRVAASNSSGTVRGTIVSFTTAAPNTPPTVQTLAATNISITGAALNGSVIPNALSTTAWFQWGTDNTFTNPNATNETVHQSIGAGTTSVQVNETLSNLLVDTVYYFRVVAQNSAGQPQLGLTGQFRTSAQTPTVTTQAADNITTTGATLHGLVNPNGLLTTALFQWGTDNTFTNPALYTTTPSQGMGSGLTAQSISASVSLSTGTTYYFRVAANNSAGPSTGTTFSFTTPQNPPPTAIADFDETLWMAGPYGSLPYLGRTVVTLDGSGSLDDYGTITSYEWTQIGGTNPVTISDPTSATTTFAAPAVAYGTGDNLVFQLKVTDNRGLSHTDNVWKNIIWGFNDDFNTDSTGTYLVTQTLGTHATFAYNSGGKTGQVVTGASEGLKIFKLLRIQPDDIYVGTNVGVFFMDFNPTSGFGTGGDFSIRLIDDMTSGEETYYELSTKAPASVRKVRGGIVVDSALFPYPYSQGVSYRILITFSPENTTFEAFGGEVSLTTNTNSNSVNSIEIELNQQNALIDNLTFGD